MKVLKWVGGIFAVYVLFVVVFESYFLGVRQPDFEVGLPMVVLTTTDESGASEARKLAGFEMDGKMYVSAHHWPRGWYRRAVSNPAVQLELSGTVNDYLAVPVTGVEFDRVADAYVLPLPALFLMGFPPEREILRLDPVEPAAARSAG